MCRLFDQSLKVQKLLIGLILIVNRKYGVEKELNSSKHSLIYYNQWR